MKIIDEKGNGVLLVLTGLKHQMVVVIQNHPVFQKPAEFLAAFDKGFDHFPFGFRRFEKPAMFVGRAGNPILSSGQIQVRRSMGITL